MFSCSNEPFGLEALYYGWLPTALTAVPAFLMALSIYLIARQCLQAPRIFCNSYLLNLWSFPRSWG